jgi:hypothetical protein
MLSKSKSPCTTNLKVSHNTNKNERMQIIKPKTYKYGIEGKEKIQRRKNSLMRVKTRTSRSKCVKSAIAKIPAQST